MSNITKKILEKLKEEHIEKIPRWRFILKEIFIYVALILAIMLGAFSISMIIFQLVSVEWDLLPKVAPPGFGILRMLPYFWLFISALIFTFVYFDFRNTKTGHRYTGTWVVGVSLIISLIFGVGVYAFKAPKEADLLFHRSPFYRQLNMNREMIWNAPDQGIVAGEIVEIRGPGKMTIEDFEHNRWEIEENEEHFGDPRRRPLEAGDYVRVVGEPTSEEEFSADEIRPWDD